MEYLVKVSKKARILELNKRTFEDYCSGIHTPYFHQEDMTLKTVICVLPLHKRPRRKQDQYAVSKEDQYAVFKLWKYNILEDIDHGPHSKKPLIRRIDLSQYAVSIIFQTL
ncbi:hypothetical protein Tco_0874364 [Tanacetum coccineum]|uniref:Uncharacterized protein n=1 Tax=Tanacetum coccineum TaxID=301880 RepID=A0ABQ5BPC9_9ASTR